MRPNENLNLLVRTLIRKNKGIDDQELKNFCKQLDAQLERTRPDAEQVMMLFEEFKLENKRIAQILDY